MFSVLFLNSEFVVVDKPEGFFVHPPESLAQRKHFRPEKGVLSNLRRQLGQKLYPVHRLDVATSGLLVFALSSESARHFCQAIQAGQVEKTYRLVCRGWPAASGVIDQPLLSDSSERELEARTEFQSLLKLEVPANLAQGYFQTPFPFVRYTLVEASPITGRFHQIRRHFNRISHPLLGDNDHGDSRHNRFFREIVGIHGLCLRATRLSFPDLTGHRLTIIAPENEKWQQIERLFTEPSMKPAGWRRKSAATEDAESERSATEAAPTSNSRGQKHSFAFPVDAQFDGRRAPAESQNDLFAPNRG